MKFFTRLALLSAALLVASGCETLGLKSKTHNEDADLACPRVETPSQLSSLVSGGPEPLALQVSANLHVRSTDCSVKADTVTLNTGLELAATRGPALKTDGIRVPFFAAVLGADGQLLAKKQYETTFDFGSGITDRERVTVSFALTHAQAASSRVIIGYQLNRDAWTAVTTQP